MEAIGVAVISALGVVGAAWFQFRKLRNENRNQHAEGYTLLQSIDQKTERIETKVDTHLGWHAGRGDVPIPEVGTD